MPGFGSLAPGDVGGALPEAYGADQPIMDPMVRFAKKALYDIPKGLIDTARATPYGLRRQDVTDVPGSAQPIDPLVGQATNVASGMMGAPQIGPAEAAAGEVALGSGALRRGVMKKATQNVAGGSPDLPQPEEPPSDVTTKQPMSAPINWNRGRVGTGGIPIENLGEPHSVVDVPVDALDAAHKATDPNFYIGNPKQQVIDHMAGGGEISLPEVGVYQGRLGYTNGRNRVAAARQLGAQTVPVAVETSNVKDLMDLLDKHAPPDVTSPTTSATARFGTLAPGKADEDALLAAHPPGGDVDWSRMNQPFGSVTDPGSKVVIPARDPRLSITQRDLDQATDLAQSFSGGGLATKAKGAVSKAAVKAAADAAEARSVAAKAGNVAPPSPQEALQSKYGDIGTHPDEKALTVNDILHPDTPAMKPYSRNVEDIAADLQTRGQAALKKLGVNNGIIDYKTATPEQNELLARAMASEVQGAMQRGGKTATDWYTKSIDEAIEHANDIWPGVRDDPHQRMGFTAALAITSQGETVPNNVRLAEQAYEHFRQTGRFPTDITADKGKAMNANFQKINDLLDTHGEQGARDFLHGQFTVKDLENMGYKVTGENKGTTVNGSSILGSKIGGGFFQNLNGNYNPVTMDLWFMRAMGRLNGGLVGGTEKGLADAQSRLESAMTKAGHTVPNDPDNLEAMANDFRLQHERDFRTNRDLYNSGEKQKSELAKASEAYLHNLRGINETPGGGGERIWLRGIVNRARGMLAEKGHNLTNADMQAIWWYPEKELYGKLGGRDSEAINTDYATVLKNLKEQRAAAQAQPQAVGAVDQRP